MKDPFNDIGKKMPYRESEEYLDNLIDQATEGAIGRQRAIKPSTWRKRHPLMTIASAAAVILLVIGIAVTVLDNQQSTPAATLKADGPLDEFLNTLSDTEAAQLQYYEIEEIPEY